MKHSKIKDIILALIPVIVYYLYQEIQLQMQFKANMNFNPLPLMLFKLLAPCVIGVIAFFIIAYAYQNRNSLVFISLFVGAVLVNLLYLAFFLGLFGLRRMALDMSAASQIAYLLFGAYFAGFWVSLISFIRGKRKRV